MNNQRLKIWGMLAVAGVWLAVTFFAWFGPNRSYSDAERRKLAQLPELSVKTVMSGAYMSDFEDYSLDQFPRRDGYRQLKAIVHRYVLGQQDNNGLYFAQEHIGKLEYPLHDNQLAHGLQVFRKVYDRYLQDSNVYAAVVPDKGYYLAEQNGYPAMDYEKLLQTVQTEMSYASYVNLTDLLTIEDYYRTDTHWRQERLFSVAQRLCEVMGVQIPQQEDYRVVEAQEPFYGVYWGQAALPVEADKLYLLESDVLKACVVYNHETGKHTGVYDKEKLTGKDPYEVFLSGPVSLLTVTNPNAQTDRELIVFRDSFGSSLVPLLLHGYREVTLVDIRYLSSVLLNRFIDFRGQDVLFLYSTLVLNNGYTLQ